MRPPPASKGDGGVGGDSGGGAAATTAVVTAARVLLYVPNLIGYARVALVLASFGLLAAGPRAAWWDAAVLLYVGGFVGDLFDGLVARRLGQTSDFGGVLDMVTDRCSTLGLLTLLGCDGGCSSTSSSLDGAPPGLWLPSPRFFRLGAVLLQVLDVSSHWCQMYATLALGVHHKSEEGNADKNFLVRWFYRYYWFFGYLCCGAEFTYVLLLVRCRLLSGVAGILLGGSSGGALAAGRLVPVVDAALFVTAPGWAAKQAVNVMQLLSACHAIAASDARQFELRRRRKAD
jgi:CDP-diacylglycerol--inositol 3-phosphatidyltransferase